MMIRKHTYLLVLSALLALQASTLTIAQAEEDEVVVVPQSVGNVYSDIDMRVRLATKPNIAPCVAEECVMNQEFDARVKELGVQLANSAYALNPKLKNKVPAFEFTVANKQAVGTASNGAGKVVIFRGLQSLELSDEALNFIIAREMGHVIAKHHDKNTTTKLIISALASVVFPAAAIINASSAAAQATTATTLLTSAASTATSMLGSEVAMAKMKPTQLAESDDIAIKLLVNQECDLQTVISTLEFNEPNQTAWENDLQLSLSSLEKRLIKNEMSLAAVAPSVTKGN